MVGLAWLAESQQIDSFFLGGFMSFFFSRRRYNSSTRKFTRARSKDTKYAESSASSGQNEIVSQTEWLERVMNAGGDKGVVIFVHGFNTLQPDMLARMTKIEQGLATNNFAGVVVGFDWPSEGRPTAYDPDLEDAEAVSHSLVEDAIFPLLNMPSAPKVHIFGHSMGAHLTAFGFGQFGNGAGPGAKWMVDQVCFASADMASEDMDQGHQTALVLEHRSRRLTNYHSGSDAILKLSRKINGRKDRLGRVGLPDQISAEHFDVDCEARYKSFGKPIDDGKIYSHRWWFDDDDRFYKDLAMTLKGRAAHQMSTRDATPDAPRQVMKV